MIVPPDTSYKVFKYLNKLHLERGAREKYADEKLIIYLKDRGYIQSAAGKLLSTSKFANLYVNEILPLHIKIQEFIDSHGLQRMESHYLLSDFAGLILVANEKLDILEKELSLQQILSKYFNSSKHSAVNSNLSEALKTVLSISEFPEESKDFQFLSILYPMQTSRCLLLCENKNRLKMQRHRFIEFWYAGGRNTIQLQYIPKPVLPMYYLFDWDHDGISIYLHIRKNYFPDLKAFTPTDAGDLMISQKDVKGHFSKWKKESALMLECLSATEGEIVSRLIHEDKVIEEQKILLTRGNLEFNNLNQLEIT